MNAPTSPVDTPEKSDPVAREETASQLAETIAAATYLAKAVKTTVFVAKKSGKYAIVPAKAEGLSKAKCCAVRSSGVTYFDSPHEMWEELGAKGKVLQTTALALTASGEVITTPRPMDTQAVESLIHLQQLVQKYRDRDAAILNYIVQATDNTVEIPCEVETAVPDLEVLIRQLVAYNRSQVVDALSPKLNTWDSVQKALASLVAEGRDGVTAENYVTSLTQALDKLAEEQVALRETKGMPRDRRMEKLGRPDTPTWLQSLIRSRIERSASITLDGIPLPRLTKEELVALLAYYLEFTGILASSTKGVNTIASKVGIRQ
jgi:hypothetical protein